MTRIAVGLGRDGIARHSMEKLRYLRPMAFKTFAGIFILDIAPACTLGQWAAKLGLLDLAWSIGGPGHAFAAH